MTPALRRAPSLAARKRCSRLKPLPRPLPPPTAADSTIYRFDLSQCGAEALSEYMKRELGADARPGVVVSVATSGDLLQWHVHLHVLATDGAFSDDVTFPPSRHGTQRP